MLEAEKRLLEKLVAQGDAESFAAIMSQYAGMVHGTCRRILGDEAQAADATQETFFQLLKNAHHITDSLGSWLHRVATRRAVEMIRQNVSRRRREAAYATNIWHESAAWEDVEPLVDEALDEMPEDLRELLLKHYLQGHSMTQIAADTGLSQPTVSRRMKVALDQLRYHLRNKGLTLGLTTLGLMLANAAQAAPNATMHALGKITLAQAAAGSATSALWSTSLATGGAKTATLIASVALLGGASLWIAPRFIYPTDSSAAPTLAAATTQTTSKAPATPSKAKPETVNVAPARSAKDMNQTVSLDAQPSLSADSTPVRLNPVIANSPQRINYPPNIRPYNASSYQSFSSSSSWMNSRPYRGINSLWITQYGYNHAYGGNGRQASPTLSTAFNSSSLPPCASTLYLAHGRVVQTGYIIGNRVTIPCGMRGGGSASYSVNSEGAITASSPGYFSLQYPGR